MIEIRELARDEMRTILPLVEAWNARIAPEVLAARLDEMLDEGYRCIAAYDGAELVGVGGFWIACRFWCGRHIDLDNLIVDESRRNQGIGQQMIAWLHEEGRRAHCEVAGLDTYLENTASHRLYERLGYEKIGYHYLKKL
ncbi:MAG: GNAT family N-acetyltransferase [Capsulimonadaceae bacterium]|nr:GNAT family N-acetyltransferase [Capsulimonadaceae bacterium]